MKCQDEYHEDEYDYDTGELVELEEVDMANSKYCVGCQDERDVWAEFNRQNTLDLTDIGSDSYYRLMALEE